MIADLEGVLLNSFGLDHIERRQALRHTELDYRRRC